MVAEVRYFWYARPGHPHSQHKKMYDYGNP